MFTQQTFITYLLIGTVLGADDTDRQAPCPYGTYILVGETDKNKLKRNIFQVMMSAMKKTETGKGVDNDELVGSHS